MMVMMMIIIMIMMTMMMTMMRIKTICDVINKSNGGNDYVDRAGYCTEV